MDWRPRGGCDIGSIRIRLVEPVDELCSNGLYPSVPVVGSAHHCTGSDYHVRYLRFERFGKDLRAHVDLHIAHHLRRRCRGSIALCNYRPLQPPLFRGGYEFSPYTGGVRGGPVSYYDHILGVIPNNIVKPFLEGNVLSLLLIAFAVGIGLSKLPESENKTVVVKGLLGLQDLLFLLIRGLIWTLPLGILAFSAQLSAQVSAGVVADSIGKYVLVVLGGNVIQFFIILPLFLIIRGLNPIHVLGRMMPAVLMALFTKSSAATLPVTMESAEQRLGVRKEIARFVLPICTTINMNGCAAFILVTSLFVMQNGGTPLTLSTILLWILISVVSAIGNAGVPMGCFFLTLSLMSGIGAPVAILGIILPIYTIIDMVETAENVWSDSCVCAMTDHDLK